MSVHSKDGRTWLTKLERIGELSARDKNTMFNNIGHLICVDMLKEQYHQLDGNKAIGVDNVTKLMYGEKLDENLNNLIKRIRRGTYEPKPSRICEIPKEDGSTRPLAISCFEDKLMQSAVSTILGKIYEPIFLPSSYGFRPNQNCHDALKALNQLTMKNRNGALIEIDIRRYFNTIPHPVLMKLLEKKISDKRFLRLINVLITAPILERDNIHKNICGCPQGSIISPIIANIYMHYVIDEWFEKIKHTSIRGKANQVRYADDMVFTFEWQREAKRFYDVLPKRLKKYGLEMHMDKSQIISAGHVPALQAHKEGKHLQTFNFLGFTCYWGKSRSGLWRLKYTSRKDRFASKLKGLRNYLWENLNAEEPTAILKTVCRVIKGWLNYHHISDNGRRVEAFLQCSRRIIFKWFNRKGRKHPLTWERYNKILDAIGFPQKGKTISMFASH